MFLTVFCFVCKLVYSVYMESQNFGVYDFTDSVEALGEVEK